MVLATTGSSCIQSYNDGTKVEIWYDNSTQLVHFRAEVVAKHYFAYGYGTDMINVDMVAWIANGASSS